MNQVDINRINELAHKSKTPEGLTAAEKEEQAKLRRAYIDNIKRNVKAALENVDIQELDGSITHVKDIPLRKKKENL